MARVKLQEVCDVSWGDTTVTKASYVATGYPAFSASGCDGFLPYFDHDGPGIVLSAIGAQCGKTWFTRGKWSCIKNTIYIKSKSSKADTQYVFYALSDPDVFPKRGAAQPFISQTDARNVEIQFPPLALQRRITGILSAYDDLIENCQRRIQILEEMASSLYREWFVNFRYPGHESVPLVPSVLGEIPQGWEVKALGEVCSRITDGSHFSPQSVEDGYPMASVKDMHDWGVNLESCRRIAHEDYESLVRNDCKPLKNDVLIAKDGSYLKHTFVVAEEQELVILSSIAMLRPNEAIRPNYLVFALRDPITKARMRGIVSGVAIPRIVLKDFRMFHILVPSSPAQDEWAQIVDPLLESCRKLVAQIDNLRQTRDLLLPRLMSGQLEVSVD